MNEPSYKKFLHEVVSNIIDKTKDDSLFEDGDIHSAGYRMAIYSVLYMIENEALAWGLAPSDVGLKRFSPDKWLLEGRTYWLDNDK